MSYFRAGETLPHMSRALESSLTLQDIADFLGISANFLRYVLYGRNERKSYRRFNIPKRSGGYRQISVPPNSLKIMQRKIAGALLALHPPKPSAHGFLRGRSVVTNAKRHEAQRVVGNIDLSDFFPSIHVGRISKALQNPPYSLGEWAAVVVAQICCEDDGKMPQGAPSSPILSNIICRNLDEQLQKISGQHGCRYTRYADDITFSTSRPALPRELMYLHPITGKAVAGEELDKIIVGSGFTINREKVRIAWSERRQEVTGLTTNERVNVHRRYVRELDSLIHIWRKYGALRCAERYAVKHRLHPAVGTPHSLANFVRGKFSYLLMVKGSGDPVCRRIQWELSELSGCNMPKPVDLSVLKQSQLRGIRGRFKGWQNIADEYAGSVKFLEIRVGPDLFNGTAFVVDSDWAVTAGHNVAAGPVRLYDGDTPLYPSRVFYINRPGSIDFALLHFDSHPFRELPAFHFEYRLPQLGEEVAAIGYPQVAQRYPNLVVHTGTVESLPLSFMHNTRFIQTVT